MLKLRSFTVNFKLGMKCERKRSYDAHVFGLSNWEVKLPFTEI